MDNHNTPTIQNCGIYTGAGGNVTAKRIKITINPSPQGTSTATTKSAFRFNIPTPTRHFKGRRDTMEAVHSYFIALPPQTADCWERIVAIVGLGGMGKTETAYKFAAEYKTTFPNVAWINAETKSSAMASFRGLANRLGVLLNDCQDSDLQIIKEVYRHIDQEDYGSVLFIFDNAIRLNSDEEEFGIFEYLPTDDLPNQRFPYVLITTQTHDWERQIQTFKVDELTEEESLEFFRSCFQIETADCDDLFKMLHKLLQGYPLVMNLAASHVDYIPRKHSVNRLKQEVSNYIEKLEKEQNKLLNEKMNRAWPTKYTKTLSNVWQLTFERLQQEDNGREALEFLQIMSFLHVPLWSGDVQNMVVRTTDCPHPPEQELQFQLKESIRVLERFYTVRILKVNNDDEDRFSNFLGLHRLVQFVVRQQIDSSNGLERVLFYFASAYEHNDIVNKSALEEALHRSQLSQRALLYVGVLACHGSPGACKFVEARQPETKSAATIWRLYKLERGMITLSENATQVLYELIELTKSEKWIKYRYFFGDILIRLLADERYFQHKRDDGTIVPGYFSRDVLEGVKELVVEPILNVCCAQDLSCKGFSCQRYQRVRDAELSRLPVELSKRFIQVGSPMPTSAADVIAGTWFALFSRLRHYDAAEGTWPEFLNSFWKGMYKTFHSPDASQPRIASLRTALWNRGLAMELIQVFGFISRCFPHASGHNLKQWVLNLMDVCMDGMDLKDERAQQVISSFCQMITTVEKEFISKDHWDVPEKCKSFAVELCSVWIKLFLMDVDPPSHELLESLCRLEFLDWLERSPKLNKWNQSFFSLWGVPEEYLSDCFPQFIQRFSPSKIEAIQKLFQVCERLTEVHKSRHPRKK